MVPERLCEGDTVGIIALASPPDQAALGYAIPMLESLGIKVKLGKHLHRIHGYLAGTDEERVADFHEMLEEPEIKAIFFACGGYGSGRIAPLINYRLVASNPKILWGYSDMTYMLTSIRQFTGLSGFHGPMPASDFGKQPEDGLPSGFEQLFEPMPLLYTEDASPLEVLSPGEARGELVGGNLSVLISTIGTPFEIMTKGKLLLIEDVNEEPYRIDSMLQQLTYAGKIAEAAGVVVGDFANAVPKGTRPSLTLETVLAEYLGDLPIPVVKGFDIGHCTPHYPIPLGVEATLSAENKLLIIDPGVQ